MIKICSLWKRKTNDEKTYYKGSVDILGIDILLFPNKSDHPKSPALDLLIAKTQPKEPKEKKELSAESSDKDWGAEDDIPF